MAKQKLNKPPPLSWVKSHKLVSVLVVIFVLACGAWAYQKISGEFNKLAFIQARRNIDTIYADILTSPLV